ncbi:MAG: 23S rRNA (guanosine(2251)-2'-O)-methyltransferase RlmB [Marinoscillum sp.]|mgnify:CR=1 FL=1|nr:23S rRNA (guanosine(2251)-2'-O)-methyltransferase RlmB [Marinoscillum sp.]OUX26065.1 MAG: 23S rRNA (guanosine(2251)-2'-O)-methyltransferase RlmB [Flammeovirgaceae bacterium TMED262]|tara:strand:+ start:6014 stop:6748 length:735 start_codon:yes stop_codon:yes gene_type:complete
MKNQDIIFGKRPVLEAIRSGKTIEKIFIQKNLSKEVFDEIKKSINNKNVNLSLVPKEKLNRIIRKNHQGVICYISPIDYQPLSEIVHRSYESGKDPIILVLDRITDTRNFGAITRVAEATGVDAIVIPEKESALITSEAVKASAGALNYVSICKEKNLKSVINKLKESGLKVIACTEKSDENIYSVDFNTPVCIILGSEKNGISQNLIEISDVKAKIPMRGKIESLNVSSSSSIILYELIRQRI